MHVLSFHLDDFLDLTTYFSILISIFQKSVRDLDFKFLKSLNYFSLINIAEDANYSNFSEE
jgi:hypothetical protein